jgi:hypothetical protein
MDAYPRVVDDHSEAKEVHFGAVEANPELWKLIRHGGTDAIDSHPETVESLWTLTLKSKWFILELSRLILSIEANANSL